MLQTQPLSKCFPEYQGPNTLPETLEFVKSQFLGKVDPTYKNKVFIYDTTARFKTDLEKTWKHLAKELVVQWKVLNPNGAKTN